MSYMRKKSLLLERGKSHNDIMILNKKKCNLILCLGKEVEKKQKMTTGMSNILIYIFIIINMKIRNNLLQVR